MSLDRPAHVILVGLPGVGKSTAGISLADRLGIGFCDFDAEIERRAGRSVARIFAEYGEQAFRDMEADLTHELRVGEPMVLAPGGGWITNRDNVALLRPPGCIIYMKVSPEGALARMGPQWALRPLLAQGNGLERIRELYRERRRAYEAADFTVETEHLSPQEVTEKLASLVVSFGARR